MLRTTLLEIKQEHDRESIKFLHTQIRQLKRVTHLLCDHLGIEIVEEPEHLIVKKTKKKGG